MVTGEGDRAGRAEEAEELALSESVTLLFRHLWIVAASHISTLATTCLPDRRLTQSANNQRSENLRKENEDKVFGCAEFQCSPECNTDCRHDDSKA